MIIMNQTKQNSINEFIKGEHYDGFFKAKNNRKYLTAYMHLHIKFK